MIEYVKTFNAMILIIKTEADQNLAYICIIVKYGGSNTKACYVHTTLVTT